MEYASGSFGRVFLVKFGDGDDLLAGLKEVAVRETVTVGLVTLLGGLRSAGVVSGPKEPVIPPEPMWQNFTDGREVLGIGTIVSNGKEPVIHLHGAIGRGGDTTVGCIRRQTSVYLVIEAVIAEITGVNARKALNEKTGLSLLEL